jgi:predicted ATPase
MFSRIQTRHFRSLKGVDQALGPVQALVGPNASGKTTFLDVIGLLGEVMKNRGDVRDTVLSRSATFSKLVWHGASQAQAFQLAVEAPIPPDVHAKLSEDKRHYTRVRYEVEVGLDAERNEIGFNHETLWLESGAVVADAHQPDFFPKAAAGASVLVKPSSKTRKVLLKKLPGGNDNYYPEGAESYNPSFKLGRTKSALSHIPADEKLFPASIWFRTLLETGVRNVVLNSQVIKQPSPPGLGTKFQTDGSNLPWVVAELRGDPRRFAQWLAHVQTALEDIVDIDTVERDEDRHRYLTLRYANGAEVPSWLVSDGTLRLLALTVPAYLPELSGVFLVEEPENGIHPRAIETVIQSLSSVYQGQVLIATHSPVALNMLEASQVLCFAKDDTGATDIVAGHKHPALRDWKQGQPDLGTLFAAGILS